MDRVLWESWELMSQEEQNAFLNSSDLLDCYLSNHPDIDIDTYDKDDFEEYCADVNNEYFEDDFGRLGNWTCSPLQNQEVVIQGELGLWDGKHQIRPERCANLYVAIQKCLQDYNVIAEDGYGNLIVCAHHHDGVNRFVIKKVTDKGVRCLHFCKTVFGKGA